MTLGRIAEFIEDCERSKMLFHPSFINISQLKCVPCYGMYHKLQKPLLVLEEYLQRKHNCCSIVCEARRESESSSVERRKEEELYGESKRVYGFVEFRY